TIPTSTPTRKQYLQREKINESTVLTPQPTIIIFQTTTATATVTPSYFQDQNVIIEDIVIALIAVFTFILA
ncbi:14487_t:CDS:2, partial [Gigaspora rosea]